MLALLLGLGLSSSSPSADDPSAALRVMSFNIRYGTALDGDNAWLHRDDLVVETIRRFDPDVLGVQEALAFQLDFLSERLEGYVVVGQGREGGRKGEYSALLLRKERVEIVESGQFWLSEKPDEVGSKSWDAALPRICTHARLRDRRGGREFVVMNTHFDHRGAQARANSARLIASRLPEELPVIVMGDLNAGEDSAPLKALREAGLVDSFRVCQPEQSPAGTFNAFRGERGGAKIDYVMLKGDWKVVSAAIDDHHRESRYPSDHFPVNAVLTPATPSPGGEGAGEDGGGLR